MHYLIDDLKEKLEKGFLLDDLSITALKVECERNQNLTLLQRHPYLFHGLLSIICNLVYPFIGIKKKVKVTDEDFVFISSVDPVFRTKNIGLITGDLSYCIIHLPNFHIKQTINYYNHFKNQDIKAFFPTISLRNVLKARKQQRKFFKACKLDKSANGYKVMESVLSLFLIYDNVAKDFLRNCNGFNGKWILEHQIYFYAPVIFNLRSLGKKTTMLQHGIFFKPTDDYFPVNCDRVLCCSEREKKIYMSEGVPEEKISVLGVPLQTLSNHQIDMNQKIEYSLLILLPMMNDVNTPLIQTILSYINDKYKSVLLRFRPRSRDNDMRLLGNVVNGFSISEVGIPISQDLARCRRVITFSADAIVEVVKVKRPFVYIWLKEYRDFVQDLQCATMDNYKEFIDSLMKMDAFTNNIQEMSIDNIGEQDVDKIRSKFVAYVKS